MRASKFVSLFDVICHLLNVRQICEFVSSQLLLPEDIIINIVLVSYIEQCDLIYTCVLFTVKEVRPLTPTIPWAHGQAGWQGIMETKHASAVRKPARLCRAVRKRYVQQ